MIPQSFTHDGPPEPWNIPLYRIASSKGYQFLRALLIEEGLVDPILMDYLQNLGIKAELRNPLYTLDQPFIVDLAAPHHSITFLTRKWYASQIRVVWFADSSQEVNPYSGESIFAFFLMIE